MVRVLALRSRHHGSAWFNFSAVLVNGQLVCIRPVGILFCSVVLLIMFRWLWKAPLGSGQLGKHCIVLY